MEVITYEEYENDLQGSPAIRPIVEVPAEYIPPVSLIKKSYEWLYFHPENPVSGYRNFKNLVTIEGKEHEIVCENGQVKTMNEVVAVYLSNNGYILINKAEVPNVIS